MTTYMYVFDNRIEFTHSLYKSRDATYEVINLEKKDGYLKVSVRKKHFEYICPIYGDEVSFSKKEQAIKFCSELKVKRPLDIIKERKTFFGRTEYYILSQFVECEDGDVSHIVITEFPIIDYAGVLKW